jgi:hypothetical protein
MPSHLHEAFLQLLRNRLALTPKLLRALHREVPEFSQLRIESAELTEVEPTEYRADLVLVLDDPASKDGARPVLGIVVEVQLSPDPRKEFVWPVYVANLRARLECPVWLLVVAVDEGVARWSRRPIDLGDGNTFTPLVLGPSDVPIVTDPEEACADPELAVLSVIAHGPTADIDTSVRIAKAAQVAIAELDEDLLKSYYDLVMISLTDAAREVMQTMEAKRTEYLSDFARRYHSQGVAEGLAQGRDEGRGEGEQRGRARLVMQQLTTRFGPLPAEVREVIATASVERLDDIGVRVLTASTLGDAVPLEKNPTDDGAMG